MKDFSREELERLAPITLNAYRILSHVAEITMPLADTFWGAHFAMLTDRYGISWMLNYDYPKP